MPNKIDFPESTRNHHLIVYYPCQKMFVQNNFFLYKQNSIAKSFPILTKVKSEFFAQINLRR